MADKELTVGSIISFAARAGLPMGLWLCAISACVLLSVRVQPLSLVALILAAGVPFLLWKLIRPLSLGSINGRPAGAGTLWLGGIYCFIFGALVSGLFSAVWLIFAQPDFAALYLEKFLADFKAAGSPQELASQADIIRKALDAGMLPGPMEIVVSMMWSVSFLGSVLSAVVAYMLSSSARWKRARRPQSSRSSQ